MICSPCVPSLAATKKVLSFYDQPEIIYVNVSYMEYGRTHKHSLRRARQTHDNIRRNTALLAYSNKPHKKSSAGQVWLDQAISCLKKGHHICMNTRSSEWTQMKPRLLLARISVIIVHTRLILYFNRD